MSFHNRSDALIELLEEMHTLSGATERPALLTIRHVVAEMEPLRTVELNDYINPTVLVIVGCDC